MKFRVKTVLLDVGGAHVNSRMIPFWRPCMPAPSHRLNLAAPRPVILISREMTNSNCMQHIPQFAAVPCRKSGCDPVQSATLVTFQQHPKHPCGTLQ